MKRIMTLCLVATLCVLTLSAQETCGKSCCAGKTIYDISVKDDAGRDVSLSDYKGKVQLIVNTATRCGFTPQYKELEALYEKYQQQGLEILDFPCNQFGQQAPGTIQEIHEFCTANFDIRFPQFDKIDVNGPGESPLFTYLKSQQGFAGFDLNDQRGKMMDQMLRKRDADYDKNPDIKWNFTKFLVSRDGRVLKRYEPTDQVAAIEADIQTALINKSNTNTVESMKSFGSKPWIIPQPVLIIGTYDKDGKPNAMNAAWGGQWDMHEIVISLSSHATTDNLKVNNEFTVAFATAETEVAADYVGIVSGRNTPDKMARTGWTTKKAPNVNAPVITNLPLTLECRVKQKIDESETGYYLVGEIVNVLCDEKYLAADGNPDVEKMGIITYDPVHHTYIQLGKTVGKAFSDGKQLK